MAWFPSAFLFPILFIYLYSMANTATDVITVADAKDWLSVGDDYSDKDITRLIKTAISWVEQYTCYRLFPRDEVVPVTTCNGVSIAYYPINTKSVKDADGEVTTNVTYRQLTLELKVICPVDYTVELNTGFEDATDIPQPLLDAARKLIVYLYENRDSYSTTLPVDIQVLINQYRRSATI